MNHADQHDPRAAAPSSSLGLDDVYFTFFRHTRIITICFLLGVCGALVAKLTTPSIFSSKAKLRVSYVMEEFPPAGVTPGDGARIVSPTSQDSILNSEVEILTSRDVARQAAEMIGPAKVLAAYGGGDNTNAAAAVIRFNFTATAPRRSDVISVAYEHRDPELVRPILNAVIRTYLEKHAEIHLGPDESEEYVSQQLGNLRKQLLEIEAELDSLLRSNKVVSPAETRQSYLTHIDRLTGELLTARTALALRRARSGIETTNPTDQVAPPTAVPPEVIKDYSLVISRLEALENLEREYNKQGLKPAHPFYRDATKEIAERLEERGKLERLYPLLVRLATTTNGTTISAEAELAEIRQLESTVQVYEAQINELKDEVASLTRLEPRIQDLQRLHDEKLALYKKLSHKATGVDARAGNVPGVKVVENPTPPARSDKKMMKLAGVLFGGFFMLGIVLAVALDYVFDRTIKRSVDVERTLRQRAFYTIPHTFWTRRRRNQSERKKADAIERKRPSHLKPQDVADQASGGLATWRAHDQLREHAEGLRERIVTYFEINGLYHKPKLVALTSCHEGAGVTSLASSLAAALSLTGDGNVMLVDLCTEGGSVTSFYRGKPGCGLNEKIGVEDILGAEPGDKLVVAKPTEADATYENLARVLPTYFKESVPKLKTSGYDYVVFDLPPVSQTSITPRLSSQMDLVLMVLESEKTAQPIAKQAALLMREAHANLFYVLNKCRRHVPEKLSFGL